MTSATGATISRIAAVMTVIAMGPGICNHRRRPAIAKSLVTVSRGGDSRNRRLMSGPSSNEVNRSPSHFVNKS